MFPSLTNQELFIILHVNVQLDSNLKIDERICYLTSTEMVMETAMFVNLQKKRLPGVEQIPA